MIFESNYISKGKNIRIVSKYEYEYNSAVITNKKE